MGVLPKRSSLQVQIDCDHPYLSNTESQTEILCIHTKFIQLLTRPKQARPNTRKRSSFSIERKWTKSEEVFFIEKSLEKFHDN